MPWPPGAIRRDGHMGASLDGFDQFSQGLGSPACGGSSDELNGKESSGPTDQFPIPVTTDQRGDSPFQCQERRYQESTVPIGDDHRFFVVLFAKGLKDLGVDLLAPHGEPNKLEESIGEKRNQKQQDPLAQSLQKGSSSLGHFLFSSNPTPGLSGKLSRPKLAFSRHLLDEWFQSSFYVN